VQLSSAILDALPVPALLIDGDERLAHANPKATAVLGGTAIGRSYVAALRQPVLLDCVEAAFRLRQPGSADFTTTVASRDTFWRVTAAPVDMHGGDLLVLVTFEDQTATQEARQMRQDFVANVSHELRTPLTALIGFVETLRGAARDDAAARDRFLDTMAREANRMNRLVADLLSLSRVESVERMRPTDAVDLSGILNSVVLAMRPLSEQQKVSLELRGTQDPVEVPADPDQLSQVFTNLVENAVKYGASVVSVQLRYSDGLSGLRGPGVEVTVEDDGEGIDPVHIPRLTERFYRVDSHRSREKGGTGLGLAIVKHIVNRHRGRLRIESEPGQGSRFTVLLPALG